MLHRCVVLSLLSFVLCCVYIINMLSASPAMATRGETLKWTTTNLHTKSSDSNINNKRTIHANIVTEDADEHYNLNQMAMQGKGNAGNAMADNTNSTNSANTNKNDVNNTLNKSYNDNNDNANDNIKTNNKNNKNGHFTSKHRNGIIHLFEWKFTDISKECIQFLGPKGYAGVQISSPTENLIVNTNEVKRPWWERYHPVSYQIATRSGNVKEFHQMVIDCNGVGVRIYVEIVINHMAAEITNDDNRIAVGTAGAVMNATHFDYPGVPYSMNDFHKTLCLVEDYNDINNMRNCQLDGRPDLDHSSVVVRIRIVNLLNSLIDMGVAGFIVNAAKYLWPNDLKKIIDELHNLNSKDFDFPKGSRPTIYLDIIDLGLDPISKMEYSELGIVTEYLYAAELATIIEGKVPLSTLINWGPAMGFLPHQDSLIFINTPMTQQQLTQLGNNQLLNPHRQQKYIMANAFMLMHPYGKFKRILSSYKHSYKDLNHGPPTERNADTILSPKFDRRGQCTMDSGWICEHRWIAIVNMIELINALEEFEDVVNNFQIYGSNQIAFCRGRKAFIAINNDLVLEYATQVQTCLPEGMYCDVITGGINEDDNTCHGTKLSVNKNGWANISLAAVEEISLEELENQVLNMGILAIYIGSKLNEGASSPEVFENNADENQGVKNSLADIDDINADNDVELIERVEGIEPLAEAQAMLKYIELSR